MSHSECYYIDEIPVQEISTDRMQIFTELLRKRSQDARLHEIKEQLHVAENRCNTLKGQLDYMKMFCHSSDEHLPTQNLDHQFQKSRTNPHLSNTSITPHKEILPLNDDEISRYPVQNVSIRDTAVNTYCNTQKYPKDTTKLIKTETLKKLQAKLTHTISDTYLQNVAPIYGNTVKIPATNSLQRKTYKTTRPLRINESRDTIMHNKKRTKPSRILDQRKTKINEIKISRKALNDDIASVQSSKTQRRHKVKRSLSRATVGTPGHRSRKSINRDWNCDLVEIYHNKKAKSLTESNSDNSLATTKRGYRKGKLNTFARHKPSKSFQKYTLPTSYPAQQYPCYGQQNTVQDYSPQMIQSQALTNLKHTKVSKAYSADNQYNMTQPQTMQTQSQYMLPHAIRQQNKSGRDIRPQTMQYCSQQNIQYMQPTTVQQRRAMQQYQKQWQQYYKQCAEMGVQPMPYPGQQVNQSVDIPIVDRVYQYAGDTNQNYPSTVLAPIDEKSACSYHKSGFVYQDRHYQLPTISSRLKQVTKSYLQQFNIKMIPFVPARATTPSHNLGLNIQQVLSIMKTHQPITGISPTLAHNMGLVAQSNGSFTRGTEKTINNILSRMGSKQNCAPGYRRSVCPLLRQATEIAETELADVPEHPCEDSESQPPISPRIGSALPLQIPKTISNTEIDKRVATEWDQASPHLAKQKCTCLPRKGVTCNRVFNQYMNPEQPSYNSNPARTRTKQYKSAFSMRSADLMTQYHHIPPAENQQMSQTKPSKVNFHNQLAGKVRGLRDVLANLHDDFQKMNEKYDALSERVRTNSVKDPDAVQQLQEMERELNAKEEEITVVIALYKEVLALKEQVRNLKERTSVLSMSMSPSQTSQRQSGNCEPTVTLRLTKLLRQIQHFQGLLKQRL